MVTSSYRPPAPSLRPGVGTWASAGEDRGPRLEARNRRSDPARGSRDRWTKLDGKTNRRQCRTPSPPCKEGRWRWPGAHEKKGAEEAPSSSQCGGSQRTGDAATVQHRPRSPPSQPFRGGVAHQGHRAHTKGTPSSFRRYEGERHGEEDHPTAGEGGNPGAHRRRRRAAQQLGWHPCCRARPADARRRSWAPRRPHPCGAVRGWRVETGRRGPWQAQRA